MSATERMHGAQTHSASPTPVPLLDLKAQFASIEHEVMQALREVCATQQFILGPRVELLEQQVAQYSQCRFGVGMSSGTDALLAAMMALEIGPTDEVITSPYSFFASAGAIARLGARPVFCDIDPVTFNLAPQSVAAFISDRCVRQDGRLLNAETGGVVKALIPVHLFGQMADMGALLEIARAHNLRVIEDAAQAIGSEIDGARRAGSLGDIGCLSFFPSKNLGAFGDAGMCTTNDPALADRLKVLRSHGGKPKYHHAVVGGNFRLDELQAAVLLVKLKYLDAWTERRQANAAYYDERLAGLRRAHDVLTPARMPGVRHAYNQYAVRARRRDELRSHLTARGIGSEIYYPVALHMQACFASAGYRPEDCPEALRATTETLAIPIYPELTPMQMDRVIEAIAGFYRP